MTLVNTRSSDCGRPGSLLKSIPSSNFAERINFMLSARVLRAGLKALWQAHKMAVESAAPEFAKLQPANKEESGLGFTNKYNTYSILNELRWALDPDAEFPRASIVQLTNTTWYDPHTNPSLSFVGLEETLERRVLLQAVTKRIKEVSRGHSHPRACRGVARCSGRRLR